MILEQVHRVLVQGGILIIVQPNIRLQPGRYYDDYTHKSAFSEISFCDFLESLGWNVITCEGRFLPLTMKSRVPKPGWIVRLYLSLPFRLGQGSFFLSHKRLRMTEQSYFPSIYRRSGGATVIVLLIFNCLLLEGYLRSLMVTMVDMRLQPISSGRPAILVCQVIVTFLGWIKTCLCSEEQPLQFRAFSCIYSGVVIHGLLPSFLVGIGLIWATYGLGRVLWVKKCALFAVILLTASGKFFLASHSARPDILLAFYLFLTLYLLPRLLQADGHGDISPQDSSWSVRRRSSERFFAGSNPVSFLGQLEERKHFTQNESCGDVFWRVTLRGDFLAGASYWPHGDAFSRQFAF